MPLNKRLQSSNKALQRNTKPRLLVRSGEVERRKNKLRETLEEAIKNAEKAKGGDPIEAAVHVVEQFRLQELAFDMNFDSAAHFLHAMGVTHCALFGELLVKLQKYFADGVRSNPHVNLADFLKKLHPYSLCTGCHQFVCIALETLMNFAEEGQAGTRSWISQAILENVALAPNLEGESQLDMMPDALRGRIYECKPELFLKKVEPYIMQFVRDARRSHGHLLVDLKKRCPSERRKTNAALQGIRKCVGSQQKLYSIVKKHLVKTFAESPTLRSGCDGEDDDELVSIGPEPFLSTIRSDLLLSFVDDGVLTHSPVSGWWLLEVKFDDGSHLVHYTIYLLQRGASITGKSRVKGINSVEGSIDGNTFRFRQIGDNVTYVLECQVSQDMRKLTDGRWSFDDTNQKGGSFTGSRVGPVKYLDMQGCEWDACAELIVALDHTHQRKYALDDLMCVELPVVVGSIRAIAEPQGGSSDDGIDGLFSRADGNSTAAGSDADAEDANDEDVIFAARFALVDPCVIQSVCRGLLAGFRELSLGDLDEKGQFSLLLLLVAAQMLVDVRGVSDLKHPSLINEGVVKHCREPGFADLEKGAPSIDDLEAYGLNHAVIAGFIWCHAQQNNLEMETEALLSDALLYAVACRPTKEGNVSATSPAHTAIRLIVNSLVNKCLVVSTSTSSCNQYRLLEESLKGMASHNEQAMQLQTESAVDCVQQQAVNMIVSSGLRLRELFHLGIRQPVVDHLILLSKQDAWIHRQALELLQLYRIPNFATAREEITSLRELLQHGKQVDTTYDWTKSLSEAYKSIVEGHPFEKDGQQEAGAKGYLAPVYSKSDLGQRYPLNGMHSPQFFPTAPPQTLQSTPMEAFSLEAPALPPPESSGQKAKASGTRSAVVVPALNLPESHELRAEYLSARSELEIPDAVMAVDVSLRIRDFCTIRIAAASGVAHDVVPLTPTSREARRAEKALAATEAAHLMVKSFQGVHNLALVVAGLVCVLISSRDLPGSATNAESLLRYLTIGTLVSSFKYVFAQPLITVNENCKWVHQFPQCREWRTAIYNLMADKGRGHYSEFLTFQLELMQQNQCYQDELMSNISSIGNLRVFHEMFRCAIFNFFDTLFKAGSRKGYNESVIAPAVQEVCRITRYWDFPWIYAQAYLHELIRMRPRERHLLRFLAKAIGEVPGENWHRVANRFTTLSLFPQLCNIVADLESQRRRGDEIHIRPHDVSVLCNLIEDLLDWKIDSSSVKAAGDQTLSPRTEDYQSKDDATQAASSVGAGEDWFADERPFESEVEGSQAGRGSPSSVGRGRRTKGEKADEVDSGTASIWHMRAISSREAGSEVNNNRVGPQSPMAQAAGALDAVRRLPILNELLFQLVDPTVVLGSIEDLNCHARLLALLTTDGFLQEVEDLDGSTPDLDAVASTARATIVELTRIYKVTHSPLCKWAKQVETLRHLQCSPVASLAGLRWISKVLLKGGGQIALARTAAAGLGALFVTLRGAYMQHPSQAKAVLEVIHQLLELVARKDALDEDMGSDHGSEDSGHMRGTQGEQQLTGAQIAKLGQDIERLAATEFVQLTCGSQACFQVLEFLHKHVGTLGKAVMRHFASKLLPVLGDGMSSRMAWAIARLLVHESVLEVVVSEDMVGPLQNFLKICRRSVKMPQADALDGLDILKKRYEETQEAMETLKRTNPDATKAKTLESIREQRTQDAGRSKTPESKLESSTESTKTGDSSEPPDKQVSSDVSNQSILDEKTAELADYFQMSMPVATKLKKKKQAAGPKRSAKGKAKSKAKRRAKSKTKANALSMSPTTTVAGNSEEELSSHDSGTDSVPSHDSDGEETFDFAAVPQASGPHAAAESIAAAPVTTGANVAAEPIAATPMPGAENRSQNRIVNLRKTRRARAETGLICSSAVDGAGPEYFNSVTASVPIAVPASSSPSFPAGPGPGDPICTSAVDSAVPQHINAPSASAQTAAIASSPPRCPGGPAGPICTSTMDSALAENFSGQTAHVAAPASSPATADANAAQVSTVDSQIASAASPALAPEILASGIRAVSGEAAAPPPKRKRCLAIKGANRDTVAAAQ